MTSSVEFRKFLQDVVQASDGDYATGFKVLESLLAEMKAGRK